MSSDVSDSLTKEEIDAVEQATEEKVIDEAANGSEGGENEEEEEDEEEDDDDKKEKSLIVEGKREKKKVERLSLEMTVVKKEPVLTEGKGQKLHDIERIYYFLKKKKCEELRLLHRLLFNRPGTVNLIKKNIGQFNGFAFEAGSDQHKKKEEMLKKFKKSDLKNICGILDLEKSGANIELVSRILNFLLEPKSTGKSLPKSKSKTPKGGKKERSSSGSARKSKSRKSNVILSDESSSEDEKKGKESSEEEKESEEEEEPPKKIAKKEKAKPKSTPKSKKASKSAHVKKADSSTTNKKSQGSSKKGKLCRLSSGLAILQEHSLLVVNHGNLYTAGELLDCSLLQLRIFGEGMFRENHSREVLEVICLLSFSWYMIKKMKKPPTDEEIRETVKKLLAEANLEEVTMKQICKKVNESYPTHDLSSRKNLIKTTVKELIS
ncbi:PREDICTED: protein DEK [Nanorana parkeri]|uniref:protein DEK n=1 Tax=Nanorana parkeri TaxID=125878 RepID=UPI000854F2F1|nr:PREDICTED: protein DEK [Nanorana parkeri]